MITFTSTQQLLNKCQGVHNKHGYMKSVELMTAINKTSGIVHAWLLGNLDPKLEVRG